MYKSSEKKLIILCVGYLFCLMCAIFVFTFWYNSIERRIEEEEFEQKTFVFQGVDYNEMAMEEGTITEIRVPQDKLDIIKVNEESNKVVFVFDTEKVLQEMKNEVRIK